MSTWLNIKKLYVSEDTTTVPFDLKLQKSIEKLGKVAIELNHYVQNLEDAVEKIDALINFAIGAVIFAIGAGIIFFIFYLWGSRQGRW